MSFDSKTTLADQHPSPLSDDVSIVIDSASPPPTTLTREHLQQHKQQPLHIQTTGLTLSLHNDSPTTACSGRHVGSLDPCTNPDIVETSMTQCTLIGNGHQELPKVKSAKDSQLPQERNDPADTTIHQHHNYTSSNDNVHYSFEDKQEIRSTTEQRPPRRHPSKIQGSLYTRFFSLETAETYSSVIVHSSWVSTGWLFFIRMFLFLYTFTVLVTDLFMTDRPQYSFCYLTQLSYLGLTSYLGTVSWHTFSEWRRERALRVAASNDQKSPAQIEEGMDAQGMTQSMRRTTTIERQHWLLTDMNFFLYHTICTFHIIVPLLYWGYLSYEGDARSMAIEMSSESLWRNYSFHGGDLIVVLIEIAINTMPFILTHFLIVFSVCLLYLAEAHLVYRVDGFWIYPFLDTTGSLLWMALYVGVALAIALAFVVMYYVHRIRIRYRTRNSSSTAPVNEMNQDANVATSTKPTTYATMDENGPQPEMARYTLRQITRILETDNSQHQNRKRSCSNGSDVSTASTLVGSDDMMIKNKEVDQPLSERSLKQAAMTAASDNSVAANGDRLEKVEEENEVEIETSELQTENHNASERCEHSS
ncbi:hypothetical protein BGX28_002963 [Mortierella sp. GBA30]|nr:hypothetical protein BGX28_002963 [Mortierella sp. GBA30]